MGDLLYLTENTYLFQHFSEITPEQAWELGERTRGAVTELEKIGATVYGLASQSGAITGQAVRRKRAGIAEFCGLVEKNAMEVSCRLCGRKWT